MYSEIPVSLILIKKLGGQCDIVLVAYVSDCHMTENWMLQTCDFMQNLLMLHDVVVVWPGSYYNIAPGHAH